jgi:hypothetical protein
LAVLEQTIRDGEQPEYGTDSDHSPEKAVFHGTRLLEQEVGGDGTDARILGDIDLHGQEITVYRSCQRRLRQRYGEEQRFA